MRTKSRSNSFSLWHTTMMPPRICVPKINTQNYTKVLFGSGGECAPSVNNLGNLEMDRYQLPAFPSVDPRLASHLFTSTPMALCLRTWPVSTTEPEQYGTRLCASNIIHIRTRHVSFSILIGRNSVAEWLIVASTYHLNSDPKWLALLILWDWLWLQSVLYKICG